MSRAEPEERVAEADELRELESRLGYRFRDRDLLRRALTHRSYAHEVLGAPGESYERLEFLGDALLGFLVADWLCRGDPVAHEGVLTRRRQEVVRARTLAGVAERLDLGRALLLGRGERESGGRAKPSLLADAMEAVLAAVYLDGGIRPARAFVRRHLKERVARLTEAVVLVADPKSHLQEQLQGESRITPTYHLRGSSGPDHARTFHVEVRAGRRVLGSGAGSSRKQAEQAAAREALDKLDRRPGKRKGRR